MNILTKYKRNRITRTHKIIISFILLIFTIGIGFSALITNLSIAGNLVVKKYVAPTPAISFPTQIENMIGNETCFTKYEGNVTDKVGVTETATNVYFNKCNTKRNIIFGGFCWQMIRTTETGGIKMIFNGEPVDGKCESDRGNHKGVYGTMSNTEDLSSEYLYGNSYSYDLTTDEFTLTDTFSATWSDSTYENLLGKFTCKSSNNTCTTIYSVNSYCSNTKAYTISYTISGMNNYSSIVYTPYNAGDNTPGMVGYKYNKTYYTDNRSLNSTTYKYGNTFTYDTGTNMYTLSGTTQNVGNWSSTGYTQINNTHYTCFNTTGECSEIYYIHYTSSYGGYYIVLKNGKSVEDALNEMLYGNDVNRYDSNIKQIIEIWYRQNLASKESFLEDTVYCNDRSVSALNGWNPNGGDPTIVLSFKNYNTVTDLTCSNNLDQFAVGNNNAKLTYPIGLIDIEEWNNIGDSSLRNVGVQYWSMSPYNYAWAPNLRQINSAGSIDMSRAAVGWHTRPAISLKNGTIFSSGDGSTTSPWVVQES